MTGREIKEKRFDKAAMFGYRAEEVDLYLSELAQAFDNMNKEKAVLEKKLEILAAKIEEYRKDEDSMKEALLGAQRLGNTVVAEAQAKASKIVADAEEKADAMVKDAEKNAAKAVSGTKVQVEKEQQALLKIQKEVSNFKARLLALYKSHLDLITSLPEAEGGDDTAAADTAAAEAPATPVAPTAPAASAPVKTQSEAPAQEAKAPAPEQKPAAEPKPMEEQINDTTVDPVERAKRELESTQQIAKKQLNAVTGDLEKTQQIAFANSSQRIPFKSERIDVEKSFESKFGDLKFGKNNK